MAKEKSKSDTSTATLGFEAKLRVAAETLRNNMDAEAYLGPAPADTFLRGDKLFAFGDPPVGNANYACVPHLIHHLRA